MGPGRIHVTETVHECLRDRYEFDGPSIVDVKGKGEMRTYYLLGERPERGHKKGSPPK